MSEKGSIEVAVQWDSFEDCLAEDYSKQNKERLSELPIQILIGPNFIHDFISVAQSKDSSRFIEDLLYGKMHPLPQQTTSIVHLLLDKVDFNLLVHIDFADCRETCHQYIILFYAHPVSSHLPRNTMALEMCTEPCQFLLEWTLAYAFNG